jgi:signal transduction histidine kinase
VAERHTDFSAAAASSLQAVEESVVSHYFRLQQMERKLQSSRRRKLGGDEGPLRLLEEERARLGRELHAGVGQALAGIRVHLELMHGYLPQPPEPVRGCLDRIGRLAEGALDQVRSVARRLHPPEWQGLAIQEALRQLWDLSGIPQRFEAHLDLQPLAAEPPQAVKILIYRMVQEALSNIVRHAEPTRVGLSLISAGDQYVCTVEDNGKGFDATARMATAVTVGSGIGLRSIRDQAAVLGGEFSVESGPGGTTLQLRIAGTRAGQEDACRN